MKRFYPYPEEIPKLLDGTQTAIVRAIEPQPYLNPGNFTFPVNILKPVDCINDKSCFETPIFKPHKNSSGIRARTPIIKCPFGQPGEVLVGKETWRVTASDKGWACLQYRIDGLARITLNEQEGDGDMCGVTNTWCQTILSPNEGDGWKSPITMPLYASRLHLKIKDVRVMQVQDLTEEDAKAWGISFDGTYWRSVIHPIKGSHKCWPTVEMAIEKLWNTHNPDHLWADNPWLWHAEVERQRQ